jgi:hypothetical protein
MLDGVINRPDQKTSRNEVVARRLEIGQLLRRDERLYLSVDGVDSSLGPIALMSSKANDLLGRTLLWEVSREAVGGFVADPVKVQPRSLLELQPGKRFPAGLRVERAQAAPISSEVNNAQSPAQRAALIAKHSKGKRGDDRDFPSDGYPRSGGPVGMGKRR